MSLYDRDLVDHCHTMTHVARATAGSDPDLSNRYWVRALEALIRWAHV